MGSRGANGTVDKGVDFANYFCTYGFLYHQKEMLCDRVRMDAYYNAIFQNKHHFQGKAVLDVGTGSGILAIWSAQAGARKVYAVEATKMAEHARELVKANKLQDIVEVIEGSVEDVTLPEKVDLIISEWMGYFLLRESMLDSVIHARDRWLKPNGVMYPSHARMWMAPIRSSLADQKMSDYEGAVEDWYSFVDETKANYGVDMSVLTNPFTEEQGKYYLQVLLGAPFFLDKATESLKLHDKSIINSVMLGLAIVEGIVWNDSSMNISHLDYWLSTRRRGAETSNLLASRLTSIWNSLHPNQIIGTPVIVKELDCLTTTVNDIRAVRSSSPSSITAEITRLCGFGGWFDVHFRGSNKNPAQLEVELTTAPSIDSVTHWGQQVFLLHPPQRVQIGDDILLHFSMSRSKDNHRLMDVDLGCEIRQSSGKLLPPFQKKFYIE